MESKIFDKKVRTYSEQLDLLEKMGLIIENRDEGILPISF